MPEEIKEIMTAGDLAAYLGFSKNWIYRRAEVGEIPGTQLGNRWRFKKSVIDQWLEERVRGAKPSVRRRPARARAELEGRLAEGLRFIRAHDEVTTADYAAKFGISLATARKDLHELIDRGLVRKLGGGRDTRYAAVR